MNTIDQLPSTDKRTFRKSVAAALEKYRIFKYLAFEERESRPTTNYEPRYHGHTNKTSDETSQIATYNVDTPQSRQAYCEQVERAVDQLPRLEKLLITERYMNQEAEYITDYSVYCHRFDPPISEGTYSKIRDRALHKIWLAIGLNSSGGGGTT